MRALRAKGISSAKSRIRSWSPRRHGCRGPGARSPSPTAKAATEFWLAGRGLQVRSIDFSPVALAKARKLAAERGVALETEEADLGTWRWPEAEFNLVVAIFIQFADSALREQIFAGLKRALKPGGLLLLQGYGPKQLEYNTGGPPILENLYTEKLLRAAFLEFDILELRSHDDVIYEGSGHVGMSALVDLVARKP